MGLRTGQALHLRPLAAEADRSGHGRSAALAATAAFQSSTTVIEGGVALPSGTASRNRRPSAVASPPSVLVAVRNSSRNLPVSSVVPCSTTSAAYRLWASRPTMPISFPSDVNPPARHPFVVIRYLWPGTGKDCA